MLIFRIVHWFNFNFREYVFVLNNFFLVLTLFSSVLPTSLVAQTVKHLPTMQETQVQSLGQEDPLEKEMAPHSSTLAWKNPMDGGSWWATVHGVAKSWIQLSDFPSLIMNRASGDHLPINIK